MSTSAQPPDLTTPQTTEELLRHHFHWFDYTICCFMFLISISVGLFYGFCHVSKNAQDYLMGGRKMPLIPVSMSLIASFISGISIMGTPAETYFYGMQYVYILFGIVLGCVAFSYIYLPVFYNLGITSVFEYLERRFDKNIRIFTSCLFTITLVAWLPLVIYVPALAINQVVGTSIHVAAPIICITCIFYTSLGGIKAVVWTDVIQGVVMFGALLVVAIKGTYDLGGFNVVWDRNMNSTRLETPNFDFDLMTRHTFWSMTVGGTLHYLQCGGMHQTMFQRYMSLSSITLARAAVAIFVGGMFFVVLIGGYTGSLMYATFHDCDPWSTGVVNKKEQVLVVLVMKVMNDYPGLLGIFVAGILSASLSSLSTGLNSMAAVVLEDFYHAFSKKPLTEKRASIIMKLTTVILGVASILMVHVVEKLGTILQLSMSVATIGNGPAFGIFTMGILMPWVKVKGALAGGLSSLAFMTYLCFRAQAAIASGELMFEYKPLSTDGCTYDFTPKNATIYHKPDLAIHNISYLWYSLSGTLVCIIMGSMISLYTEAFDTKDVEPELLSPIIRRFYVEDELLPTKDDLKKEVVYKFEEQNGKKDETHIVMKTNDD